MVGKWSGRIVWLIAVGMALVGWYFSWQLNVSHLRGKSASPRFVRDVCTAHKGWSCDAVAESKYGKIPFFDFDKRNTERYITTSLAGAVYFGMMLVWTVLVGRPNRRGRCWHLLPMLLNFVGMGISAWLSYILVFQMSTLCPWCLVCHAANLILLICTFLLWPRKARVVPAAAGDGPSGVLVDPMPPRVLEVRYPSVRLVMSVVLLAVSLGGVQVFYSLDREMLGKMLSWRGEYLELRKDKRVRAALQAAQERMRIPWREDDPVLGDRNAPETLTVFSNFECPSCKRLHESLPGLLETFEGRLRIIYKHNPFSTDCNPHVQDNVHPHSCEAAYAAEAARVLGGNNAFWQMGDLLFENQGGLAQLDYSRLAKRVGLDPARFKEVMASEAVKRRVKEDLDLARRAKCVTTPDLYRNDIHFTDWSGPLSPEAWKDWVRESRAGHAGSGASVQPSSGATVVDVAAIPIRSDDAFRGPADAPNTLVVFYSLQSDGCQQFHLSLLPEIEKVFGPKLRVVIRHMPIDKACNPHVGETRHRQGCQAAYAAEAARVLGGPDAFWKILDVMMRNPQQVGDAQWKRFAQILGLDPVQFASAMRSKAVAQRVAADVEVAGKLHVPHTPVFYFNNKLVRRAYDFSAWKALAAEAKKPGSGG